MPGRSSPTAAVYLLRCFAAVTWLLGIRPVQANPPALRGVEQIVVFDAGSSGTRVHVFNVVGGSSGSPVPPLDLAARKTLKVKPGLSKYGETGNLTGAKTCIEGLLDFANQHVQRRAETPIYLKATAGLRALGPERAEKVLEEVRDTLAASGYKFKRQWAGIIQGKEEGGLAWVAANYLRKAFGGASPLVGVIELGGGSTQMTFNVDDDETLLDTDTFTFTTLHGQPYKLYAHSYLGFGQDYVLKNYTQAVLTGPDPCFPAGYTRDAEEQQVKGEGDVAKCKSSIETTIKWKDAKGPGFYPSERTPRGSFVITENFFWARKGFLKETLENLKVDMQSMLTHAKQGCDLTASEDTSDDDQKRCFKLSYQAVLLDKLKVFDAAHEVHLVHEIDGSEVDWALGAAVVGYMQNKHAIRPDWQHADTWSEPVGMVGRATVIVVMLLTLASILAWKGQFRAPTTVSSDLPVVVSKGSAKLNSRARNGNGKGGDVA